MCKLLRCGGSFLVILACVVISLPSLGAVPQLLSYQGQLNQSNGQPVNGALSITFLIYDLPTGGSAIWTETQTVNVSNGVFGVQLGSSQPLAAQVFDKDELYLAIKVGADVEMTPRQRLTSMAFSQRAEVLSQPIVPIGGIVAWHKSLAGTPTLPDGWAECNGQTLADARSPYNGRIIPDLNGVADTSRFLRGQSTSGQTGGSESHAHSVPSTRSNSGTGGGAYLWMNPSSTNVTSTLPSYFSVVWIMRVR